MAHPDLDRLLELLTGTAEKMLNEGGEFYPFAGTLHRDGHFALVDTEPSLETQEVPILAEALRSGLAESARAGELRALGLCIDSFVTLPGSSPTDALEIELEHADGDSFTLYYPYRRLDSGLVRLESPQVFTKPPGYFRAAPPTIH